MGSALRLAIGRALLWFIEPAELERATRILEERGDRALEFKDDGKPRVIGRFLLHDQVGGDA